MPSSGVLTVYAVRHGETEYNRRRLMQGRRIDAPLNATGARQANALAERLADVPLDAIWVSSLSRARQTAAAVEIRHPDVPVTVDDRLAEMSWGELEGRSIDDVAEQLASFARAWREGRFDDRVGGGESIHDVRRRADAVLVALREAHPSGTVLVVTHGRFLRVLLTAALGESPRTMDRFAHANTGVYRLRLSGSRCSMDLENCTDHLLDLAEEEA